MEQGTTQNPNLQSLERTTGKIVFFPDSAPTQGQNFGVITMSKVDMGTQTEKTMFPIDGAVVLGVQENISITPVLSFEGLQFTDDVEALVNFGTLNADDVQSSATGSTVNITAKLGKTFRIGKRNISNVSVTVSAATKTLNVDYFLDLSEGLIRFPFVAAGIADAASVVVTFDCAASTLKSVAGGNTLNTTGIIRYYERDTKSTTVRAEWILTGILTPKSPGDSSAGTKNKNWQMEFAVSGNWTKLKRAS